MNEYPALTIGIITTFVTSAITLAIAFGVPVSPEQQQAIVTFIAALAPLATGLVIFYRNAAAEKRGLEEQEREQLKEKAAGRTTIVE
jgi:phosphotransferase system  glucose/maltose/N-acetylglucosamine-specific IIC component